MTNIEITQNFIENLEKAREELGWTQAQMAEKLQMSLSSYKYMIISTKFYRNPFVFVNISIFNQQMILVPLLTCHLPINE